MLFRLPQRSRIRRALLWRVLRLAYEAQNMTNRVNVDNLTPDAVLIQRARRLGPKACSMDPRASCAAGRC